jgi:radical SAM superfamily enzyme YgiQ (UPF0313 family)
MHDMRLLLVDNLVLPEESNLDFLDVHPHLGLLSLAAVAGQHGHQVEIYDPKRLIRFEALPYDGSLYERVAADLLRARPGAVGFTTLGASFLFAVNVARILEREEPDLPILLGGPHATMLSREILERFPQFDVIVRHEAEETLPGVLHNLERRTFEGIPGISWRGPGGLHATEGAPRIDDLDSLPILPYDLYPVEELGLDLMRVEAGRGCPFTCTFCSTARFFQRRYRLKSPGRIVEELDRLHDRYGITEFKLDHDLFTVDRRKVLAFCEAVQGRGYRWRVSARVDCVDRELLERMAAAGCVGLYFGIETGSARMQRIAQKRLDLDLVEPMLDVAERLRIETTASFITGYPEETREDLDATLDMLGHCFRRPPGTCLPQLHILTPEPGTPLFAQHSESLAYDGYATHFNARLLDAEDDACVRRYPDIFASYFYYPAALPRRCHTFAVDAVDVLRRLGNLVLGYALRFHDGRLSALIDRLYAWATAEERAHDVSPELIIDFIAAQVGAGHHLTSLVRHAFCVHTPRRELPDDDAPEAPAPFDAERLYRRSSRMVLFWDLHDCARLLERIRERPASAAPLDEAGAGERGSYVVMRSDTASTTYRMDEGVCSILELFAVPSRCRDVAAAVWRLTGGGVIDDALFEDLVRMGMLVPASGTGAVAMAGAGAEVHGG